MIIRQANVNDAEGIARVAVDTWKTAYRGIIGDDYLDNLSYQEREKGWRGFPYQDCPVYIAENDDQTIIGFAAGGLNREAGSDYRGEVYAVYVDQRFQKQGIGNQLFRSVATALKESGSGSLLVWVLSESPYRRFYEGLGGRPMESKLLTMDGFENQIIAYGWLDINELL